MGVCTYLKVVVQLEEAATSASQANKKFQAPGGGDERAQHARDFIQAFLAFLIFLVCLVAPPRISCPAVCKIDLTRSASSILRNRPQRLPNPSGCTHHALLSAPLCSSPLRSFR